MPETSVTCAGNCGASGSGAAVGSDVGTGVADGGAVRVGGGVVDVGVVDVGAKVDDGAGAEGGTVGVGGAVVAVGLGVDVGDSPLHPASMTTATSAIATTMDLMANTLFIFPPTKCGSVVTLFNRLMVATV